MEFTLLFAKIVGPVLFIRALSIVLDRQHFIDMIEGVEGEITTVAFSFFPIALFMTCTAIAVTHSDTSSLAALLIHAVAWGGIVKSTALMLVPRLLVMKGKFLVKAGFLNVVLVTCFVIGGYLSWFGYFAPGNG